MNIPEKTNKNRRMFVLMELRGRTFFRGKLEDCRILIEGGKIVKVEKNTAERNVRGVILPAGVDMHVHFRDPGYIHKEDFYSGSVAAAFGGISCVFDMPNTKPRVKDRVTLEEKREIARGKSVVDFSIYAQASKGCDKELDVKAYKLYTYEDRPAEATGIRKMVSFHCENEAFFDRDISVSKDITEHARYRSERSEMEAVREVNSIDVKKHFAHISSLRSLELAKGTKEVTPHHMLLDFKNINMKDAKFKVNPPIRNNGADLLKAFNGGMMDVLASDHAPHTLDEKEDFESAPSGMPGVETMYPVMLSLVKRGIVDLTTLMRTLCEKPAELMGLKKGRIKEGYDADLVLVDFEGEQRIREEELHSRCDWSAFEGFSAVFPYALFVRGVQITEDRDLLVQRGFGSEK
jgi:dihydroorotase